MRETRRDFVRVLAAITSGLALLSAESLAQEPTPHRSGFPEPPPPADPQHQDKNAPPPDTRVAKKGVALQNEKEFRSGVEKLYQMTGELKEEVEKTMTTDVLSVRMYKKMEDIEKLAKQLKGKVKG